MLLPDSISAIASHCSMHSSKRLSSYSQSISFFESTNPVATFSQMGNKRMQLSAFAQFHPKVSRNVNKTSLAASLNNHRQLHSQLLHQNRSSIGFPTSPFNPLVSEQSNTLSRPNVTTGSPDLLIVPILPITVIAVLDCVHWLEALDEKHRYGSVLRPYYNAWIAAGSPETFFSWLDYGDGRFVNLWSESTTSRKVVSRVQLEQSRVQYCSEKEREQYQVILRAGFLEWRSKKNPGGYRQSSRVNTAKGVKWIFVIDLHGRMYVNEKKRGAFHHSSFVAGKPVMAAGRIFVENGVVVCVGPNSGHYRTTWKQMVDAIEYFLGNKVVSFSCALHGDRCVQVVP